MDSVSESETGSALYGLSDDLEIELILVWGRSRRRGEERKNQSWLCCRCSLLGKNRAKIHHLPNYIHDFIAQSTIWSKTKCHHRRFNMVPTAEVRCARRNSNIGASTLVAQFIKSATLPEIAGLSIQFGTVHWLTLPSMQ